LPQVKVMCRASDPVSGAGLAQVLRVRPELLVMDSADQARPDVLLGLLDRLTADVAGGLRTLAGPERPPIVLIAGEIAPPELLTAVSSGVVVVLEREAVTVEQIVQGVLIAARGDAVIPPVLLGGLLRLWEQRGVRAVEDPRTAKFSPREIEVLRLLSDGLDTAAIAAKMHYSERSVKNVIQDLTHRHHLRNRLHAVSYALRAGAI